MHAGHAQRPVEEILSTPWPLHLVGVRSAESLRPHTHFLTGNAGSSTVQPRCIFRCARGESLCIFGIRFTSVG